MTSTPRATGEVWSERARLLCESHLFGTVHGVTRENVSVREEPGPGSSVSRVRVGALMLVLEALNPFAFRSPGPRARFHCAYCTLCRMDAHICAFVPMFVPMLSHLQFCISPLHTRSHYVDFHA